MNFDVARMILSAVAERSDGCLKLRDHHMVREARLMQEEGWIQLSDQSTEGSGIVARLTEAGLRISRLFRDDAVAQRLRDAFSRPPSSA